MRCFTFLTTLALSLMVLGQGWAQDAWIRETIECQPPNCPGPCGGCPSGMKCEDDTCVGVWGAEATEAGGCGGCKCETCVCLFDDACCFRAWSEQCVNICQLYCGGPGQCLPNCAGRECGEDGCGGTCGDCAGAETCTQEGLCCTTDCTGRECGPDGCGGYCGPKLGDAVGQCETGAQCMDGRCVASCDDQCEGRQCGETGDTPCQGSCGACREGQVCVNSKCYTGCGNIPTTQRCCNGNQIIKCFSEPGYLDLGTIQCPADKMCGFKFDYEDEWCYYQPDDCTSLGDYECVDPKWGFPSRPVEQPEEPIPARECDPRCLEGPDCAGRTCGPDGCGESCGECQEGELCVDGNCKPTPCVAGVCGPDGAGGLCPSCPKGNRCNADNRCEACAENPCADKQCGPDGCGGYCGTCEGYGTCVKGTCIERCEGISDAGCCEGSAVVRCGPDGLTKVDCGPLASACGYNPYETRYECGGVLPEDPVGAAARECLSVAYRNCDGRQCGPDGAGGECLWPGCQAGQECVQGECLGDPIPVVSEPEPEPEAGSCGCRIGPGSHEHHLSGPLVLVVLLVAASLFCRRPRRR